MTTLLAWLRSLLAQLFSQPAEPAQEEVGAAAQEEVGAVVARGNVVVPLPPGTAPAPLAAAIPPPASGPRQINAAGLALVKESEGLRLAAYQDGGGVWTIGYGHTGAYPSRVAPLGGWPAGAVAAGQSITTEEANLLLLLDLGVAEAAVSSAAPGLTDNQFAALVDFTFNLGAGALRQLLAHGLDQVPTQLLRWDHVGTTVEPGLLVRRQREVALWQAT
jgi:GH24 family phage-related lysozyme (muramidase)